MQKEAKIISTFDKKLYGRQETTMLVWSDGHSNWPGFTHCPMKRGFWYGTDRNHTHIGFSRRAAWRYLGVIVEEK